MSGGKCRLPRVKTTHASRNAARRRKISGKGIVREVSSPGMKSTEEKCIVRVPKTVVVITKFGQVESARVVK